MGVQEEELIFFPVTSHQSPVTSHQSPVPNYNFSTHPPKNPVPVLA
ncbi:hypothetical protein [Sphaerospermopsis sp. FACHB-1194]|nr:hypothetical protein [Sphaerospermopsis sp. FACHB-1194]MBD2146218.1 hypothetical protein [Sphaerospermopsis sp. FACHB-1194]